MRHLSAPPTNPHWTVRYAVGGACALLATVLTLLLWQPVLSRNPFALFYAAVMLSAWYGGLGPGLFATACSVVAIDMFLLPSFVSTFPGTQELVQVGIFGGVALLISSLNATRKRALAERDGLIALEQSAREEAERARRRSALLADVSNVLGGSLDSPAAVGAAAERVVPEAGDWCVIDVATDPEGVTFRRLAVAHADPARRDAAAGLLRDYDLPHNAGGVARVIRTGEAELMPRVNAASLADLAGREPSMAAFLQFGATSYLVAPIQARGRTLGAISLVSCDPARVYGAHDLRLAEDLAHRLGVALDNARLYRDAQDANRMKDEFLAVVSHELRTPLNAILGWSQLLHRGALDEPSLVQGMSAIERNARSQARIIDDVLDVSRIIQGKLRIDVQPLSMRRVVEEAVDVLRPAADAKGIRMHVDVAAVNGLPDGAAEVVGDPERLRQVVWNLLSNAVKFTPEGGRVDVSLAAAADAQLALRVRDTGAGIDPRFLPHVFERFRQADSSSTRAHGGLGLGLAIVRHLVELHGGSVSAASDGVGRGATFTVLLPTSVGRQRPVAPAELDEDGVRPAGQPARVASKSHPDLSGVRVLLVEDEPDAREMFASMLELCGADVTAVGTTQDAVAAFRKHQPDVLLSDIGMPGEDGYALIRQIRALEGVRELARPTPAMAITAFAGVDDRSRALREGFQVHVAKPVGSAQFTAAVAALARNDDPARPPGPAGHPTADTRPRRGTQPPEPGGNPVRLEIPPSSPLSLRTVPL